MKKKIIPLILLSVLVACMNIGLALAADYGTAIIDGKTTDRVHLRQRSSTESNSLGLYFTGTQVLCESDPSREWVLVKIGSETGYMKSEYLYRGNNPGSVQPEQPAAVVKNAGNWVNLRKAPSLGAVVASQLHNGDKVTVLGQTVSNWYYVKADDLYGYIMSDYLVLDGSSPSTPNDPYGTAVIDGLNSDRVHLRQLPSAGSKSLGLYFTGTKVQCKSDPDEEWVKVTIGSQTGYMSSEYLYTGSNPGSIRSKQPTAAVKNAGNWVNLRKEPSLGAAVASKLYNGNKVTVLGQTASSWYYVKAGDQYGYIMADYLSIGGSSSSTPNNPYGTAVINGQTSDRVHLRERSSTGSNSLGLYFTGTQVICESDPSKEWVKVKIGSQAGYMSSEYLYRGSNPGSVRSKQPTAVVKNAGNWVNLRKEPSLGAAVASKLYNGNKVTVLGQTASSWYYVKIGDQYGYITAEFLSVGGSASPSQGSSGAALSAYKSVMQNNAAFFSADDNQNMYLDQLADSFAEDAGEPLAFTKFAVVDLDHDGIPEVILWETVNGVVDYGFEVLHYQDGVVYGYSFVYRALMQLKVDGTFSFSSGAADSGFGTVKFNKDAYTIDEVTYSQSSNDSNNNFIVTYFVNHSPATANDFNLAVDNQGKKNDVAWYGFTDANKRSFPSYE